jgi:hypothetical protein
VSSGFRGWLFVFLGKIEPLVHTNEHATLKVAGGLAVTAETGGLAAAFGYYAIGSGIVSNIGGGITQVLGAATGNVEGGELGGDVSAAVGTGLGLGTLALTGGNVNAAATAGHVEGLALAPLIGGLGETPSLGELGEAGQSAGELLGKGKKPDMAKLKCPTKCPQ